MRFKRGDHVCALYSTTGELTREVARFLAEGLRHHERSWYVGRGDEIGALQDALQTLGVDVASETSREALQIISGDRAYVVQGGFNPEATIKIFNDAIEKAYTDGFTGFRAAAEMSWALGCPDGPRQIIVYEALLKALFANCRAIGFCLYDRTRMPLDVIDGALLTHPIAGAHGCYSTNRFYDPSIASLTPSNQAEVLGRLAELDRATGSPSRIS